MNSMLRADLHIHSTASDGWFSPSDVIGIASARGLNYVALCDHDTVDGVGIALSAVHRHNDLFVVPSVELSTDYGDQNIHILGYWIDHTSPALLGHLKRNAHASSERVKLMAERLSDDGYRVTREDLIRVGDGGMWRRPHLARVLVDKGYATTIEDAFRRFLGNEAPYFVPHRHMSTKEGIDLIAEAGGLPFAAHPALSDLQGLIGSLADLGLKGLEAFHSRQSELETARLLESAKRYRLTVSGGSDWHGDEDDDIAFGASMLPEPYLDLFLNSNPRKLASR